MILTFYSEYKDHRYKCSIDGMEYLQLVTSMLSTSKNVLFPGHNLLTGARVIIKVSGYQHRWLAGGYDQETGHF